MCHSRRALAYSVVSVFFHLFILYLDTSHTMPTDLNVLKYLSTVSNAPNVIRFSSFLCVPAFPFPCASVQLHTTLVFPFSGTA
jgi:hypothetical protein